MATCKFCGESGLIWDVNPETNVKRLRDAAWALHVCPKYKPKNVTCTRCGYDKLQWREVSPDKWVLYDGDLPHDCGEGAPPWLEEYHPPQPAHKVGPRPDAKPSTCKYCGATGLKWGWTKANRKALFDGERQHECSTSLPGYLRDREPQKDSLPEL
jgi:hypothetical protein